MNANTNAKDWVIGSHAFAVEGSNGILPVCMIVSCNTKHKTPTMTTVKDREWYDLPMDRGIKRIRFYANGADGLVHPGRVGFDGFTTVGEFDDEWGANDWTYIGPNPLTTGQRRAFRDGRGTPQYFDLSR